jgi:organic hydroperoxide reductase OsmC/OhrA
VTVHRYATQVAWRGSTAGGYESYSREHTLRVPSAGQELRLSGDATFGGDPALLNPEQLIVAAASACQLLEFLAIASKARIDVLEYSDDAEGIMDESDEPARIQRIVLRPRIVVAGGPSEEKVLRLVDLAHRYCYVANSLRSEIEVEAVIA